MGERAAMDPAALTLVQEMLASLDNRINDINKLKVFVESIKTLLWDEPEELIKTLRDIDNQVKRTVTDARVAAHTAHVRFERRMAPIRAAAAEKMEENKILHAAKAILDRRTKQTEATQAAENASKLAANGSSHSVGDSGHGGKSVVPETSLEGAQPAACSSAPAPTPAPLSTPAVAPVSCH